MTNSNTLFLKSISIPITLEDAWADFLDRLGPWEWYTTHTFREEIHPEQADRRYNRFIRNINQALFGKRFVEQGKGIYHVKAIEYQRRGVIHFHTLMGGGVSKLRRLTWMDIWYEDNGQARIEPYDPNRGARGYLSKYVSKGGQIDIHLPPWKQKQLACNGRAQLNLSL
jgi:hypothetical protein